MRCRPARSPDHMVYQGVQPRSLPWSRITRSDDRARFGKVRARVARVRHRLATGATRPVSASKGLAFIGVWGQRLRQSSSTFVPSPVTLRASSPSTTVTSRSVVISLHRDGISSRENVGRTASRRTCFRRASGATMRSPRTVGAPARARGAQTGHTRHVRSAQPCAFPHR